MSSGVTVVWKTLVSFGGTTMIGEKLEFAGVEDAILDSRSVNGRRRLVVGLLLATLFASLALFSGCRARANNGGGSAGETAAASPAASPRPGDQAVEKAAVSIKGEAFDLKYAIEKRESFQLTPGAHVQIESISGRIEIVKSDSDRADLYVVRSTDDREDFRDRNLVATNKDNELVIKMERVRRSALFSMFNDRGREKQRILLKLPHKTDLAIEGVNGRIYVTELDGKLSIEGVSGRLFVGKVAGPTALAGIHGPIRFVGDGQNKNGVSVEDVNGTIDLLFTGNVNLDLEVENINGQVDQGLPNAVYEGDGKPNDHDFRARIGKGGARLNVSGIHGRVRLAPATDRDIASIALVQPGTPVVEGKPASGQK